MPGLVGYTFSKDLKKRKPLKSMISTMGNFAVDEFYGHSLHIARVHPAIFNKGAQPVWNENKMLGIMFYGKIYGYEQEMKKLREQEHKIEAGSDAEFVIHAYEEFGNEAFTKLNGSYIFLIFDEETEKLTLVSDRFGTRPLYYAIKDKNLIFASAIRAILKYPYPKTLNEKTLVKFFRYGKLGILGDETWFEGIQVLPSASFLEFHKGKMRIEKYWDLNYKADHRKTEEHFVKELVKEFRNAINIRLNGDVKFGLSLSGGLDSRAVYAATDKEKQARIHAYTFGIKDSNEIKIAKRVAYVAQIKNHTIIELEPDNLTEYAEKAVHLSDGLDTVDVAFIPYAYEKVREIGIEAFLQGYALDATLGGSFLTEKIAKATNINKLTAALDSLYTLFSLSETRALLGERLRPLVRDVEKEFATAVRTAKGNNLLNKADYFTLNTRVRRFTIMGSVIAREFVEEALPTIDNEVIEVIARIPPKYRYSYHTYRKFLSTLSRKLAGLPYAKTMVPANAPKILWKLGAYYLKGIRFIKRAIWKASRGRIYLPNKLDYIDMGEAWRTSPTWRKLLNETLLNDESLCYKLGYLNKEFVKEVVKEQDYGIKSAGQKITFLVTFELMLRMHFGQENWSK